MSKTGSKITDLVVGVDASNLHSGGSATYLLEQLGAVQPEEHGIQRVIVWGGESSLKRIEDRSWLDKIHDPMLDMALPVRLIWQRFYFARLALQAGCDILFVPGGTYFGSFQPFVTICLNIMPFEWAETQRFGISWMTLKQLLLRQVNLAAFRRADGIIYFSDYAQKALSPFMKGTNGKIARIPHGAGERFGKGPRPQRKIATYSLTSPFHILYVSQISPYKHQWEVMEAVSRLRQKGLPLVLDLVGTIDHSGKKFFRSLSKWDPDRAWIHYLGEIPYQNIHEKYQEADLFLFASSCESSNSIVLMEAMAAGLPIASSNRGPIPEVLGKAAVYFDPDRPEDISDAILKLIEDPRLREEKSWLAFEESKQYTWKRCAYDTFEFIAHVGRGGS